MSTTNAGFHYNPTGKLLGVICWYTIEGAWVTPADLEKWWDELLLNEEYLRTDLSKTEAFRRAFSPNEHRYRWSPSEGVEATLRCEEIKLDKSARRHRLVRRIVLSRTDSHRQDIDFQTEMAEATFYKDPEDMKVRLFTADPAVAPHVQQYLDELSQRYERRATHLDSDKIRGILRRYIEGMNSVMVRRGVYFVHESRQSTLVQLQDLVARCSRGSSLHMIPLPDVPDQREMVKEAFNSEIVEKSTALLDEVTGLIRAGRGKVPKKKYEDAKGAFMEIRSRISEYRNALGETQDRAEAALELVEDQLVDLTDIYGEDDDEG